MVIYLTFSCFLFWGAFRPNAEIYYRIGFFALFILSILRYPALGGADNFEYFVTYNDVPPLSSINGYQSSFGYGYILLNSLMKTLGSQYIIFQIGYGLFCFILLYIIIQFLEISGKEKCLFLFVFFCTFDFMWYFWGTLRQNLANLIFWCLIIYLFKNRNKLSFVEQSVIIGLSLFIPYFFHTSALFNIILLPILMCLSPRVNIRVRMYSIVIISILIFFSTPLLRGLFVSVAVLFDDHYMVYENPGVSANIINFIFKQCFFVAYCMNYNKLTYVHKKFVLDCMSFYILFSSVNEGVVGRVGAYYAFAYYVAVGFFLNYFKKSQIRPVFLIAMLIIFIRKSIMTDGGLNSHYYFFWQDAINLPTYFADFWGGMDFY